MISKDRWLELSILGFIGGVWLMANPYFGVWHDCVLYTVQALHHLLPEAYAHDLYFQYGSQDQFSLFSSIHAWFLQAFGLDRSVLFLTVAGKLLWAISLWVFLTAYLRGLPLWLGLAVLASFPSLYDGNRVFGYGESILTGRLYAEIFCLFGLGFIARGRELTAITMMTVALFLHPLIAVPGVVAAALLSRNFGWRLISVGVAVAIIVVATGALGIEPFSRLLSRFDPIWLDIVETRVPYIFLESWSADAIGRLLLLSTVLLACWQVFSGESLGLLAGRILLLGLGCISLAWIGTSLLHDILLTQLQLWRGLWIVQIVALSLLGVLSLKLWSMRAIDRIFVMGIGSALLLNGLTVGVLALSSFGLWRALDRYFPHWQPTKPIWVAIACLPVLAALSAVGSLQNLVVIRHTLIHRPIWLLVLSDPLVAVPILGGLIWMSRHQERLTVVAGIVGCATLIAGAVNWDARFHSEHPWENYALSARPLQALIPVGSTVYWLGSTEPTWFWLRRAQYVSKTHTVGALFSRDTAMLLDYRQSRLLKQKLDDGYPFWSKPYNESLGINEKVERNPGIKVSTYLCQDTELDFLVLPSHPELTTIAYRFTYPLDGSQRDLIDCRRLRLFPAGAPT